MLAMRTLAVALIAFIAAASAIADTVEFTSDRSMDCTVLQDNGRTVSLLYNMSIIRFPRSLISRITKAKDADPGARSSDGTSRVPDYTAVLVGVAAQDWATDLRQIPATVIDTGILRNVPYKSQRAGGDYEINVYGDPGKPAGFEIGVRGRSLDSSEAKRNCVELVASLLSDSDDKATVRALKLDKDLVVRKDLTFEVTPSTAEDAYGGWWVSVYGEGLLDKVRASDKELKEITVAKANPPAEAATITAEKPVVRSTSKPAVDYVEPAMQWQAGDFADARPSRSKATGGDRVYVRAYTRKDGAYVQSHTRSAPRR